MVKLTEQEKLMAHFLIDEIGFGNFFSIPMFVNMCSIGTKNTRKSFVYKVRNILVKRIWKLQREDVLRHESWRIIQDRAEQKRTHYMLINTPHEIAEFMTKNMR